MSAKPLISICIPAYNAERWIKQTIESALAQTWENKEVIIVDDGSTDSTYKIAKSFESQSVKVISQSNKGACAARNLALTNAQGDFIQWLDADDILHPQKIENQLPNNDSSFDSLILRSCKWGSFYTRLKMAKFTRTPLWTNLTPREWLLLHFSEGYYMTPSSWLVSRKLTDLAGPWNEDLLKNQDGEYFIRVVSKSSLIKYNDNAITYYRKGNLDSVSNKHSINIFDSLSTANEFCVNTLLKFEDSEETRRAASQFINRFIEHYYFSDNAIILNNKQKVLNLGGKLNPPPKKIFYSITRNLFGIEIANKLKSYRWNIQIQFKRNYEKLCGKLLNDNI